MSCLTDVGSLWCSVKRPNRSSPRILCCHWNTWGRRHDDHTCTEQSLLGLLLSLFDIQSLFQAVDPSVNHTQQNVSEPLFLKPKLSLQRRLMANTCCAAGRPSVWSRCVISSYSCAACVASCACKCGSWVLRVYNTTLIDLCKTAAANTCLYSQTVRNVCVNRHKVTKRFCLFRLESELKIIKGNVSLMCLLLNFSQQRWILCIFWQHRKF